MRKGNSDAVLFLVQGALIAAIYAVLTLILAPISFGPVQFRISEALAVLPYFTPAAVPGLFVGCLLANIFGGSVMFDIVGGSLATLIGAALSYALRKHRHLVCIPPIISNTLIVPWVLRLGYGYGNAVWFMMVTVGIGEVISAGVLGSVLLFSLDRYKNVLFKKKRT